MRVWHRMFSSALDDSWTRDRSVLNLRIGDTVCHDLIDYLVVRQVTYRSAVVIPGSTITWKVTVIPGWFMKRIWMLWLYTNLRS